MTLRVGIDLDGVGFNFGDSCRRYLNHIGLGHLWKSGPTPEPFWDWYKDWGWTTEEFVQFCHDGADAGFIFNGPVVDGFVEMVDTLVDLGHDIIVATDRGFGSAPEVSERLTLDWLDEHNVWYDELIFTGDKTKANADTFIEDKLSNYDALVADGTAAVLLNRPWNQVPGGDGRNRIDSLSEYATFVKRINNQGYIDITLA